MSVMHMQMEKPFPELFGCLSQVLLHCCNLSCSIRCLLKWFCKNINFLIQKHKEGFGGHRHLWLQNLNIFGDGATFFIFGKHKGMPAASIISTIEGMLGYYPSIPNLLSCVMNVMWSKKWVGRSSKHVTLARFLSEKDDRWVALPLTYYCTIDNCRDNLCVRRYLQLRPLVSPLCIPNFPAKLIASIKGVVVKSLFAIIFSFELKNLCHQKTLT